MKKQLGIDASHWQGERGMSGKWLDKLVKCGVRWAIFKATQGTGFVDPSFAANRRKAEKRGILVGAYHFLQRGNGKAQADHFLRTVRATGATRDIPLIVDVERVPTPTPADDPDWRTVRDFLRRIRQKAPRSERWVYSSSGYWRSIGNPDVNGLADALWQARWDGKRHTCQWPDLPKVPPRAGFAGFGRTPLWQFGSFKVWLDGKWRSIDGNAFYGSEKQLMKVFTGRKPRPPVEERPRYVECYNDAIDEIVEGIDFPGSVTPAICDAGDQAARADVVAELQKMRLGGKA